MSWNKLVADKLEVMVLLLDQLLDPSVPDPAPMIHSLKLWLRVEANYLCLCPNTWM